MGAYFKGGLAPSNFITTDYDRAAPMGTGGVKVGGNYAASLLPHELAAEQGTPERKFADAIYLDPKLTPKLKKSVRQTSLGSQKTINSSHQNQNLFYQVSLNTLFYISQKSV